MRRFISYCFLVLVFFFNSSGNYFSQDNGNNIETAYDLLTKADTYKEYGDFEKCFAYAQRAADIIASKESTNSELYAISQHLLAIAYQNKEDRNYNMSEKKYFNCLEIYKELKGQESLHYKQICYYLSTLYLDMDNYPEAEKYGREYHDFISKNRDIDPYYYPESLNNMAAISSASGNYSDAVKYLEESYALVVDRDAAYKLEKLYRITGNFEKSLGMAKEILNINIMENGKGHFSCYRTMNKIAFSYIQLDSLNEAASLLKLSSEYFRKNNGILHDDYLRAEILLAILYEKQELFDKAEKLWLAIIDSYLKIIDMSFASYSEANKSLHFGEVKKDLELFNTFALNRMNSNPSISSVVYDNQLATKALILNSTKKVRESINESNNPKLIGTYNEWVKLKQDLNEFYKTSQEKLKATNINIEKIEKQKDRLESELSYQSAMFRKEFNKQKYTWKDVRDKLNPGEAAIEIVRFKYNRDILSDSVIYLFLIVKHDTKDYPEVVILNKGNSLESSRIKHYKASVVKNQLDDMSYKAFWSAVSQKLDGIKKVYVSPDGIYNLISLPTLYNSATRKYLLEELDINNVTNTKEIINSGEAAETSEGHSSLKCIIVGDPKYRIINGLSGYDNITNETNASADRKFAFNTSRSVVTLRGSGYKKIAPLPASRKEAENINKLLIRQGYNPELYLDTAAEESVIQNLDNPYILHIATHGNFMEDISDNENCFGFNEESLKDKPLLRTMLFFAGAENTLNHDSIGFPTNNDGILSAEEAMTLNLENTEIVVLSACETGLGEIKNGEGVYGMQRAFQVAGAKTVLMSLWNVNDNVTQQLMTKFYTKWLSGQSKREAFKEAQAETLKKYRHYPSLWGAFVMIGE